MSGYRFIDTQQGACPVRCLCRVPGVAPSRYYTWQRGRWRAVGGPLAGRWRAVGEAVPAWETALAALFARHKRRYGTRRLRVALHHEGHRVGRQALGCSARRGLRAEQPKACTPRATDPPPWVALRPQLAARPAQTDPGQPGVGVRHYVSAAR